MTQPQRYCSICHMQPVSALHLLPLCVGCIQDATSLSLSPEERGAPSSST